MALHKLTAGFVAKKTRPGKYNDGGGLYLIISPSVRKTAEGENPGVNKTFTFRWRERYLAGGQVKSRLREKGLGSYTKDEITLEQARDLATQYRRDVKQGIDVVKRGRRQRIEKMQDEARQMTFKDCADRFIAAHKASWKNKKHAAQWTTTLDKYAARLMPLPVAEIDTPSVLKCLEPIWETKTETATRVRGRIESVLGWATVSGYRSGDNPAAWKNHLDTLLAKPNKLKKIKHRPALDYDQMGPFMVKLRKADTLAAHAIELQILTATRPGEVVGAQWDEINLDKKTWTIPAGRMKADKEHTIPLSPQAVDLLKQLPHASDYVFPGRSLDKGLTTAAGMNLIKEIQTGITAHGFRSTFRDWAAEQTSYPREVCEAALAHQLKDKAEAAYFRSDLIAKRARLMADWAKFCDLEPVQAGSVTPIRKGAKA